MIGPSSAILRCSITIVSIVCGTRSRIALTGHVTPDQEIPRLSELLGNMA